jgi:hypothetical protein
MSVRQVLESEKKLKIISLLHLKSAKCGNFSLLQFSADCRDELEVDVPKPPIPTVLSSVVDECCDGTIDDRDFANIVFIAGYIAHKIAPTLPCTLCKYEMCSDKELLFEFDEQLDERFAYIDILSRGGI